MSDKSEKQKINWSTVVMGLGLIIYCFYAKSPDLTASDLSSKTITLSSDIATISSPHRTVTYRKLWTKETKAAFTIANSGYVVAPDGSLDSLKKGDTLIVKYSNSHDNELNTQFKEIPIYYLQKGKRVYFELDSYLKVDNANVARYKVLAIIGGILMLLYGFNVTNKKFIWIAGGIALAVLVILRILNKF
jgi:hypothetical protein